MSSRQRLYPTARRASSVRPRTNRAWVDLLTGVCVLALCFGLPVYIIATAGPGPGPGPVPVVQGGAL